MDDREKLLARRQRDGVSEQSGFTNGGGGPAVLRIYKPAVLRIYKNEVFVDIGPQVTMDRWLAEVRWALVEMKTVIWDSFETGKVGAE